jgi:protein TonB
VFAGFDPQAGQPFFERKRWQSLLGAVLLVGGSLGTAFYMASLEVEEPVEEEIVEAEIQNFELEEELEEPEPEPPPPPEPPSSKPAKRSNKPTPQPDIQNPDAIDENPEEGDVNSEGPEYGGGGGGSGDGGGGTQKPGPEPEPEPEPKPKPKSDKFPYNPDKPIERPADATVPKQVGGNPPVYPAELRKRNITGKVKVRLTIYKDGSVKGAKVLSKENSVDKDAEPDLFEQANKLLLKAVAAAVQTWTFKPSTYKGKPISVFLTVTIPFTLN